LVQVFASTKPEHKGVENFFKTINTIIGICIFVSVLYKLATGYEGLLTNGNFKSFLLPIIMTFLFLPFIYSIAIFAHYESLFRRLEFMEKDRAYRRLLKLEILRTANINLKKLTNISGSLPKLLMVDKSRSLADIKTVSRGRK
jgi:hypothetical protein